MRLSGRIEAAIEVLAEMDANHRPASIALKEWGVKHRFAGSGDRSTIGNLVYDALRRRASHAFAMGADTPRALVLSVVVRDWGEDLEALKSAFADDKFAPEQISDAESEKLQRVGQLDDAPDHVKAEIPEWLVDQFKTAFGDAWIEQANAFSARPSLDLRANALKSTREKVLKSLKRFNAAADDASPMAIRIAAGVRDSRTAKVEADESYLKGWVEVQDLGSQIVSKLINARPGQQILDFCAGAGGKTLAIAADMQNKGQIFAYDADRSRLAPIYDRLKRNGVRNVQVRQPEENVLDDLIGRLDKVVIDAPCTGTGTWRRRPDTKWRLSPELLAERQAEQKQVLEQAAHYVKPGGQLVYITCSVLPSENDEQIAQFLSQHEVFEAVPANKLWEVAYAGKSTPRYLKANCGLMISPATTACDGFYIAVLNRAK